MNMVQTEPITISCIASDPVQVLRWKTDTVAALNRIDVYFLNSLVTKYMTSLHKIVEMRAGATHISDPRFPPVHPEVMTFTFLLDRLSVFPTVRQ